MRNPIALVAFLLSFSIRSIFAQSFDTCASLNVPLVVGTIDFGTLTNVCVCQSRVPAFVISNPVAASAASVVGTPAATFAVRALVVLFGRQCTFPANAVSACTVANPCNFTCTNGFTASPPAPAAPVACACIAPRVLCGGVCAATCVSGIPAGRRRDVAKCAPGLTACGVLGKPREWECVNTKNDLESCGGCFVPLLGSQSPRGIDCTSIPGVADVTCNRGTCQIGKCSAGFSKTLDGSACKAN